MQHGTYSDVSVDEDTSVGRRFCGGDFPRRRLVIHALESFVKKSFIPNFDENKILTPQDTVPVKAPSESVIYAIGEFIGAASRDAVYEFFCEKNIAAGEYRLSNHRTANE